MRALFAVVMLAACTHAPRIVTVPTLVVAGTQAGVGDDGASMFSASYHGVIELANRNVELARDALVVACERNLLVKDCHP